MRVFILALAFSAACAAEKWSVYRSEPFVVYTSGKQADAQAALATMVQVQHTLSAQFGKELLPVWPVHLVLGKNFVLREGHHAYWMGGLDTAALAALLIRSNTLPFDESVEKGLIALYSTLSVQGPRVRVGDPPAQKDLDWARMNLLFTDERYTGKTRVLLANLAKGVDPSAAWMNSMGVKESVIVDEAEANLAKNQFNTAAMNGKPIDPKRWREEELNATEVDKLMRDMEWSPEDLRGASMAELEAEAQKNPRWPEPHRQMAAIEKEPSRKGQRLRHAAELAKRNVELWREAAEVFTRAELYGEAAKCWTGAEKAAANPAERKILHDERLAADRRRVDAEMAAQKAIEEKERLEIERLRQEALQRIRLAEAKASRGPVKGKVEEWWEGPKGDTNLSGKLERVDCVSGMLRLQVRGEDKKLTPLMIRDMTKVSLIGPSEVTLGCGVQKPVRAVKVEYFLKTKEVTTVTFE